MPKTHEHWMKIALAEAAKGLGNTHPNPTVGAVIVRDGQVLGKGFTQPCGGDHAEIQVLKNVQGSVVGASLYVTLEPCSRQGRTPACTSAILASGLSLVVFASSDPNPAMAGGGKLLAEAGLKVVAGVCKAEADMLNRPFFYYIQTGLPWVIAKAAMSLDGKLATYTQHSQWISGEDSRQHAHQVRQLCDAIVVGAGTFVHDNPSLTVRNVNKQGKTPLRVMMAKRAPKPFADCKFLSSEAESRFYILEESEEAQSWRDLGLDVVLCDSLKACFKHLAEGGCLQVLLEGGGKLHAACFEERISNEILLYQAPILIGGKMAISYWHGLGVERIENALKVNHIQRQILGDDMMIRGDIVYPA